MSLGLSLLGKLFIGSVRIQLEGLFCAHRVGREQDSQSSSHSAGKDLTGLSLNLPHEPIYKLNYKPFGDACGTGWAILFIS